MDRLQACDRAELLPDSAVRFAWNHAADLVAKEQAFTTADGRWITFAPAPAILD